MPGVTDCLLRYRPPLATQAGRQNTSLCVPLLSKEFPTNRVSLVGNVSIYKDYRSRGKKMVNSGIGMVEKGKVLVKMRMYRGLFGLRG